MFIAQIVVCGFLNGQCALLEDVKGPKISLKMCESRQEEMFRDVSKKFPYVTFNARRCIKSDKLHV